VLSHALALTKKYSRADQHLTRNCFSIEMLAAI